MIADASKETFWRNQAKSLSFRINFAWFLQVLAAPLLLASAVSSAATLMARREFPDLKILSVAEVYVAVVLLVGALSLIWARRHFEKTADSLIRIEVESGLNAGLSAASDGVTMWPEIPSGGKRLPLRWNLPRTLAPILGALVLFLAGLFFPISHVADNGSAIAQQPQAWSQLDSELGQLAEDALVDQEYIAEMEKSLSQLRAQDEEEWFSHASMEATDSLAVGQEIKRTELSRNVSDAAEALNSLTENPDRLDSAHAEEQAAQLDNAIRALRDGAMKPNGELLESLLALDPKHLGKLSEDQISTIKENLEKLSLSISKLGTQEDSADAFLDPDSTGDGGIQTGKGGESESLVPGGMSGEDSELFGDLKDPVEIGTPAAMEAKDLSRAIPGDLLELKDVHHTVDGKVIEESSGGAAKAGKGGGRIWRESLDPDEQLALKKYFE